MNELVNCGCGGQASMCYGFEHRNIYAVECAVCGTCTCDYDTKAEAIEAWNRAMGAKDINIPNKERTAKVVGVEKPIIGDEEGKTIKITSCENCENVVSIFDNFCPHCGARLEWE